MNTSACTGIGADTRVGAYLDPVGVVKYLERAPLTPQMARHRVLHAIIEMKTVRQPCIWLFTGGSRPTLELNDLFRFGHNQHPSRRLNALQSRESCLGGYRPCARHESKRKSMPIEGMGGRCIVKVFAFGTADGQIRAGNGCFPSVPGFRP
jgi:hypothetical protein